eukprot:CAMPEP_0185782446 /NCGR_PEP_ID=MMETSP1174-20130828/108931_1 /TAXON_ID=35687 /ORGANISM="Dictyocha speculum, Strain CCMP1381" /LENGTH=64 /DNA_ID=CAMNT_0028472897 /DNA_START=28 /DNA_END=218 /DNA_ORIENTATION=-
MASLHRLNSLLQITPLLVAVNKQDIPGAAPPHSVMPFLQLTGADLCSAMGGRQWAVMGVSAETG